MTQRLPTIAAIAGLFLMTGCGDSPKPVEVKTAAKSASEIPTGPISALTAFYKMYEAARKWSPDIQIASLTAVDPDGAGDGKFPTWKAVFVSAGKGQSQTYTYSTVEQGTISRGISGSRAERWAGPTRDATPFSNSEISVDSDAAYKAAAEKAVDWLKKNPDKPITTFALGDAARFPAPMWYIVWGTKKGGFAVYVNASSGKVLEK